MALATGPNDKEEEVYEVLLSLCTKHRTVSLWTISFL